MSCVIMTSVVQFN